MSERDVPHAISHSFPEFEYKDEMLSPLTAKEQVSPDTPLFLFDCTMTGGTGTGSTVLHWSSQSLNWNGTDYEGRVLRHNVFEAQLDSAPGPRQFQPTPRGRDRVTHGSAPKAQPPRKRSGKRTAWDR